MQEQLDRMEKKLDDLAAGLKIKQSPFKVKDDAPPRKPIPAGFERVFGTKPAPGTDEERSYRRWVEATDSILAEPPAAYAAGVLTFVMRTKTDYVPTFVVEEDGDMWVCIKPGIKPWFVAPANFIGGNVEGVILSYTGGIKPGEPTGPFDE